MTKRELVGATALVIGSGRTGFAAARFLVSRGAKVRLVERRGDATCPAPLVGSVEFVSGNEGIDLLDGVSVVVPSPGVPRDSPLLEAARRAGVPIVSEVEVAGGALDIPLVAITGTNGKSTTTELVGVMLKRSGRRPFVGGNLGTPLVEALDGDYDIAVAEISSFQLEWVDTFHPAVAAFLNLSEDHLDRHGDIETYARIKARLFAHQAGADVAVLNRDDAGVWASAPRLACRVWSFGRSKLDGPGARIEEDRIVVDDGSVRHQFELDDTLLAGPHNAENVAAAILVAEAAGASTEAIAAALREFPGLPHRMEEVAVRDGVSFINDSKGTNVGALRKSLEGMPAGRVILIAGGRSKGGDYAGLRDLLASRARLVVAYGEACFDLSTTWSGATQVEICEDFADAVCFAAEQARSGEIVLLSPACASQDQFADYGERGRVFAGLVSGSPA